MKISTLVQTIVDMSEEKFGTSSHVNDAISVGMYVRSFRAQVWLERPTQGQLDRGEVYNPATSYLTENKTGFFCEATTLYKALIILKNKIHAANDYDFYS